jgi:transcriptional regulator with XRE-family HTH domain
MLTLYHLIEKLKARVKHDGLSAMSKETGIHKSTLFKYVNDQRKPAAENLVKLSQKLNKN